MESTELNENQFTFIKALCINQSLIVFSPHPIDTDADTIKASYKQNTEDFAALERAGFVRNITKDEEWQTANKYSQDHGGRTFDAYTITEEAYKMFSPPEGILN